MKKSLYIATALCGSSLCTKAVNVTSSNAEALLNDALYSNTKISSDDSSVDVSTIWDTLNVWNDGSSNSFALVATLNVDVLKQYIGTTATKSEMADVFSVKTQDSTTGHANMTLTLKMGATGTETEPDNGILGYTDSASALQFDSYASTTKLHNMGSVDFSDVASAAITFTVIDVNQYRDGGATLTLFDADGRTIGNYTGFNSSMASGSAVLANLHTLSFNTELVSGVFLLQDRMQGAVQLLNLAAVKAIPEPATATLSLLALAGLAARRRRK